MCPQWLCVVMGTHFMTNKTSGTGEELTNRILAQQWFVCVELNQLFLCRATAVGPALLVSPGTLCQAASGWTRGATHVSSIPLQGLKSQIFSTSQMFVISSTCLSSTFSSCILIVLELPFFFSITYFSPVSGATSERALNDLVPCLNEAHTNRRLSFCQSSASRWRPRPHYKSSFLIFYRQVDYKDKR